MENMKKKADELIGKMRSMLDLCDAEKRDMTPAEAATYSMWEVEADALERSIEKAGGDKPYKVTFKQSLRDGEEQAQKVAFAPIRRFREAFGHEPEVVPGFRNNGEWIQALAVNDLAKLQPLLRTMNTISGAEGGFAVPSQLIPTIWDPAVELSVVAPHVSFFPMTSNEMDIPGWDSADHTKGPVAEIESEWLGELAAATRKTPKLRNLKFHAWKNALYIAASTESMMDAPALSASLNPLMSRCLAFSWDQAVLMGSGIGRPTGIYNSPATVVVDPVTTASISFTDCTNMCGRLLPSSQKKAIWVGSPSAYAQLIGMEISSGSGVLAMQNGKILDKPVFCTEKLPALGQKGSLMLVDLQYYALGMREEMRFERTNSAAWENDQVDLRLVTRGDGKGLLSRPVAPAGGGDVLSPFVLRG